MLDAAIDALEAAVALAPEAKEPIAILANVLSNSTLARQAERRCVTRWRWILAIRS